MQDFLTRSAKVLGREESTKLVQTLAQTADKLDR
jgi:hypothetical protein